LTPGRVLVQGYEVRGRAVGQKRKRKLVKACAAYDKSDFKERR